MDISIDDQIKCVERELALRRVVYPRRQALGKMTETTARLETTRMEAVLETLKRVRLLEQVRESPARETPVQYDFMK